MSQGAGPMVHGPAEGGPDDAFGLRRRFRIRAADTAGAFALFADEIPEGAGAARIDEIAGRCALEFVGPPLGRAEGRERRRPPGAEPIFPRLRSSAAILRPGDAAVPPP